jgi:hypothetical protein
MKHHVLILLLTIGLLLSLAAHRAMGQLTINGANPLLTVSTATPGQEPSAVTNITCSLRWRRENVITKITVSTICPNQRFSLGVLATNVSDGNAAPAVSLTNGMPATDFITSIPSGNPPNKTCTLQYTASATFSQGSSIELGNDVHTVTYTIVQQ